MEEVNSGPPSSCARYEAKDLMCCESKCPLRRLYSWCRRSVLFRLMFRLLRVLMFRCNLHQLLNLQPFAIVSIHLLTALSLDYRREYECDIYPRIRSSLHCHSMNQICTSVVLNPTIGWYSSDVAVWCLSFFVSIG